MCIRDRSWVFQRLQKFGRWSVSGAAPHEGNMIRAEGANFRPACSVPCRCPRPLQWAGSLRSVVSPAWGGRWIEKGRLLPPLTMEQTFCIIWVGDSTKPCERSWSEPAAWRAQKLHLIPLWCSFSLFLGLSLCVFGQKRAAAAALFFVFW